MIIHGIVYFIVQKAAYSYIIQLIFLDFSGFWIEQHSLQEFFALKIQRCRWYGVILRIFVHARNSNVVKLWRSIFFREI